MDEELQAAARSLIPPGDQDRSGESSPDSYRDPEAHHRRHRESDSHRDRKRSRYHSTDITPWLLD